MMTKNYIPKQHNAVSPYLIVKSAEALIDFISETFDATVLKKYELPNGAILHSEILIEDSIIMVASPRDGSERVAAVHVFVPDVDATYKKAIAQGCNTIMEPEDKFFGDRNCLISDPFGNIWCIATHVKDVSLDDVKKVVANL